MTKPLTSAPLRRRFSTLLRVTAWIGVGVVWLGSVAILSLRYVVLPNIHYDQARITAAVSRVVDAPVKIGGIYADWDGLNPHLRLQDVQVFDPQNHPALALPEVSLHISWLSLPSLELRFSRLEINHAELHVQRNAQGKILIGGIPLSQQGEKSDMSDWLLHQSEIVIADAKLVWQDDLRGAPPLVLNAVNLRMSNVFSRHRFALHAIPNLELATPLTVRGDFYGHSFDRLKDWTGTLFTQLRHTDITAWRPWFNLPEEFSEGQGGLRAWMLIRDGKIAGLLGDLALQDAITRLSPDVPPLVLHQLNGRAQWQSVSGGFTLHTEKLIVRLKNGVSLPTTDLLVRIIDAQNDQPAQGEMRANELQLETLVTLANFIPLPRAWRAQLDGYAPRGKVTGLDVSWSGTEKMPQHFKVKGHFEQFGLAHMGALPGFSNLSADIEGDELTGKLHIKSQKLHLDAPTILREPINADNLNMLLNWQHDSEDWVIEVPYLIADNADLAGNASINYRTAPHSPGILDLSVKLKHADVSKAARYTPLFALNRGINDWLHRAIQGGHSEDFSLRIKGNLKDFPFEESGLFELSAGVQDGALQFSQDWPKVENVQGNLLLRGKQMAFNATSGSMLGVPAQSVSVQIPDVTTAKNTLLVIVDANADSSAFLRLAQGSPVRDYAQGFTDRIQAQGAAHLDLFVRIPEVGIEKAEVRGSYFIHDNDMSLGANIPPLHHLNGELAFTESELHTRDTSAQILGGTANLDIQTRNGGVVAQVHGHAQAEQLRAQYPHPLWDKLQGGSDWQVTVEVKQKLPHIVVQTDLVGLRANLPMPFGKTAEQALPVRIDSQGLANGQENLTLQLGDILHGRVLRRADGTLQRGTLQFGGQGAWIEQDGLWITGELPELGLQGWEGVSGSTGQPSSLPVSIQQLHIGKLSAYRQAVRDVTLSAQPQNDGYQVKVDSPTLRGDLHWQSGGRGKLSAQLQYLNWQGDSAPSGDVSLAATPNAPAINPSELPALEVAIDRLQIKNKQIGKVAISGAPQGADWRLQQLDILNPDGSLRGSGVWHGGAQPRTDVNAVLQINDAGSILARSGYPKTVEKGSGSLSANLTWNNTPMAFDLASLEGSLKLDTGKGRFLKIEPGIAKLLGILSLQALPRHITLDFTDIFSDGFQFDSINGTATLKKGVMTTQDLHIDGSAAKVTMRGWVNLPQETQDLRVDIMPTVGESISLIGGFAAGPLVGVGTLLFSKIMGNPFDKLVSFQYNITGNWSDPQIVKAGAVVIPITKPEKKP